MFNVTRTSIYGLERAITVARAMEESVGRQVGESDSDFNAIAPCLANRDIMADLITDMTLKGTDSEKLARAVHHSMDVIDAEKNNTRMNCAECPIAPSMKAIELLGWETGCDYGVRQVFNTIGPKDLEIMMRQKDHCLKIITVNSCIKAPLHWWGEMSHYVNTDPSDGVPILMNICSDKLTPDDIGLETLSYNHEILDVINELRDEYIRNHSAETAHMILSLLPSGYNHARSITLTYKQIHDIYHDKKPRGIFEWGDFCNWVEALPYFELITEN